MIVLAILLAQAAAPDGLRIQDEGVNKGFVDTINCTGASVVCSVSGRRATFNVTGGGGGTPPGGSSGNLQTNNGAGGFGAYAGTACPANQYLLSLDASGFRTCAQVSYSQITGTPSIPADISGAHYVTTQAEAGLSAEAVLPTCTGTDKLTFNGTTISCQPDVGGGSGSPGGVSGDLQINSSGSFGPYLGSDCPFGRVPTRITRTGALVCIVPFYSLVTANGAAQPQRPTLNLRPGANTYVSCQDDEMLNATDCTVGSAVQFVAVTVDFGVSGRDMASTVVTGQQWVQATSLIVCMPTGFQTNALLRSEGAEDALIEGLLATVSNRVTGGFKLTAMPRVGNAYGKFIFACSGGASQ